jgi:hypothetical protein
MTEPHPVENLDLDSLRMMIQLSAKQAAELKQKLDDAIGLRDDMIRRALAKGGRATELADDAGMKVARIYQIKYGRR